MIDEIQEARADLYRKYGIAEKIETGIEKAQDEIKTIREITRFLNKKINELPSCETSEKIKKFIADIQDIKEWIVEVEMQELQDSKDFYEDITGERQENFCN